MNLNIFKKSNLKWITLIILFTIFLIIAISVKMNESLGIDSKVYNTLDNYVISEKVTPIVKFCTQFGGVMGIIILTILSVIIIKTKEYKLLILTNTIFASGLNFAIKQIIRRDRPTGFRLINEHGYSFPSGHSMTSMAFYGLFIYLIFCYEESKKKRILYIMLLSVLIGIIGISRIYLGVHYATDVLGGFILAICYLIIFTSLTKKYIERD